MAGRLDLSPKVFEEDPLFWRSGPELIRATRVFAREQRGRSWWHLGSAIAAVIGTVVSTLLPTPWPLRAVSSCVAGLTLVRMFILYHDHNHGALLQKSPTAKLIMLCFG